MSPKLLNDSPHYQKWLGHTESCLLFLGGHTQLEGRNGRGYTHSWLSPVTSYVTEDMRNHGQKVVYYCCHPGNSAERHQGKDVIFSIAYQMLEWKPEILRWKYQQFKTIARSKARYAERETEVVTTCFQVLREVLVEMKDLGMVFIVLDRVDQCDWKLQLMMG